jgi:hypothetical protein
MYDVPTQPDSAKHMTLARWVGWIGVCVFASILSLSISLGVTNVLATPSALELPLEFALFVLLLNGALWLLFLRSFQVPPTWIPWALPGGILAGALALVAGPEQVPAPYGLILVLATLFITLFLSQWLTLRRHLAQAGALVLVEAGVYLLIYGLVGWVLLDALARLE